MTKQKVNPSYRRCLGRDSIDDILLAKCDQIYKLVNASFVTPIIQNYPPVVVGCFSVRNRFMYIETTYSPEPDYTQTPELHFRLSSLGIIGQKRPQCSFPLGHCAEPKAAFRTIKETNSSLRNLRFSTAFRPRTQEPVEYCCNCKDTFNI